MKYLLLLLLSFTASASYLPESKVGQSTDGMTIHSKKLDCEAQYSESCISIRGIGNAPYSEVIQEQTLEANNVSCVLCDDEFAALVCDEGFKKVRGILSVYCYKFTPKHIADNPVAKSAYDLVESNKAKAKQDKKDLMKPIRDSASILTPQEMSDAIKHLLKKGL